MLFQTNMSESRNNMKRYSIKTFTNFIYFLFIVIIISYVYVQGYTHTTCRGPRTTDQSQFSPSACESQGLNSGHKCVYPLNHPTAPLAKALL